MATSTVFADQNVNGYIRRDGTYVAPYTRSNPDQYRYNNYGSQSNGGYQRDEYSRTQNQGYNLYNNSNEGQTNYYDYKPYGYGR